MAELTIREKARATHVKRWQVVRVAKPQTLAEHSYLVVLLAEEIVKLIDVRLSTKERLAMYEWGLYHDLVEVVTGDLNSLVKTRLRSKLGVNSVDDIESGICDRYDGLKKNTPPIIKAIVKCADLMEAISFLEVEGMGRHADSVQAGIKGVLNAHIKCCQKQFSKYVWSSVIPLSDSIYEDLR